MADDALPPDDGASSGREFESLFARDENDILVRRDKETRERFEEMVTVVVDGYPVEVPRAVPKTDAMGNELKDADGQLVPRTTTIYDAATELVSRGRWTDADLKERIPVLCHAPHLTPVGMCRMCSVHISSVKKGKLTPNRKLVPACQHRVETDMVVTTRLGAKGHRAGKDSDEARLVAAFARTVNDSVSLLAEFLLADHRHPDASPAKRYDDELSAVARTLGVEGPRAILPRNPGGENGRNHQPDRYARARRVALPIALTPIGKEEIGEGEAAGAWKAWNRTVDEKYPYSSPTVVVDHDRCILCDRCARSCSEVRPFKVIGHTGKGYDTRISFDLDALMRESSCVQCGECMTACPTGALSLRRRVQPRAWDDSPTQIPLNPNTPFPAAAAFHGAGPSRGEGTAGEGRADGGFLTAEQMQEVWLAYDSPSRGRQIVYPFRNVPYTYLKWNEGAVRRWEVPAGEKRVLCREGDYGTTAFLLQGTGQFYIHVKGAGAATGRPGPLSRLFGRGGVRGELGRLVRTLPGTQLVLGEMACLNHERRTATVVAEADPAVPRLELAMGDDGRASAVEVAAAPATAVVYEITRNMLDMMQRSRSAREDIEELYTARALENCMLSGTLFASLTPEQRNEATRFLHDAKRPDDGKPAVEFRFVEPGEKVVAEGDALGGFYVVRLGFLRVEQTVEGKNQVIALLKRNENFGELALLADELRRRNLVPAAFEARTRTATVTAIDASELIRVPGPTFLAMCERFPEVKERLIEGCARIFAPAAPGAVAPGRALTAEFVEQGIYQAQKMLALDLTRCTRCDECTKACADSHPDGHARLLREGFRFGDYLVATSCRSCHKPYCMEGCPVDAIHRRGDRLEVLIEDHCIGCGLCEKNCPYGSIRMVAKPGAVTGEEALAGYRMANNCDLCGGGEPFCVEACPHDAAFRLDGKELFQKVSTRAAGLTVM